LAFLDVRRVMMESFEVEVYVTIAAHWDDKSPKSVGRRYEAVAAPMMRRGKLLGHVTPEEVQSRFDQITDDIVSARRAKIADEDWTAWIDAADDFEAAGQKMRQLQREMGAAVDAAEAGLSQRRLMIFGAIFSAVLGALILLAIQALG
jgi:hypothetical protein